MAKFLKQLLVEYSDGNKSIPIKFSNNVFNINEQTISFKNLQIINYPYLLCINNFDNLDDSTLFDLNELKFSSDCFSTKNSILYFLPDTDSYVYFNLLNNTFAVFEYDMIDNTLTSGDGSESFSHSDNLEDIFNIINNLENKSKLVLGDILNSEEFNNKTDKIKTKNDNQPLDAIFSLIGNDSLLKSYEYKDKTGEIQTKNDNPSLNEIFSIISNDKNFVEIAGNMLQQFTQKPETFQNIFQNLELNQNKDKMNYFDSNINNTFEKLTNQPTDL